MDEETSKARKRKVRLIAGIFIGLLIVLTLAGNTIQALTLPRVATTEISKGALEHVFEGSATVNPTEERDLTNPAGWKVSKVLVKKGDTVHKGQALVQYDGSDALQQIANAESVIKQQNISLEQTQLSVLQAMQGDDEVAKLNAASSLDLAKLQIEAAQKDIQVQKKKLSENQQIVAPFDGVITDVGAIEGLAAGGGPDIKISNSAKGYNSQLYIPSDMASLLSVGEELDSITVINPDNEKVSGTIANIDIVADSAGGGTSAPDADGNVTVSGPMYTLTIALNDKALIGGERIKVHIDKTSDDSNQFLVPNKAVHKEMDGAYVYVLSSTSGPLGNSYYAERRTIKISEANDTTTAVSEGLNEREEVIVDNTGLITNRSRVHK